MDIDPAAAQQRHFINSMQHHGSQPPADLQNFTMLQSFHKAQHNLSRGARSY
jgi:hypothetical protein